MIPNLNDVCTCCGGNANQPILQLFNDKCFRIVDGSTTSGSFCLDDFAFPTDGYQCHGLNVEFAGGEITLFDNQVNAISPNTVLDTSKLYARGILLKISYPINDENGEEILLADKSVTLVLQNAETLVESEYPLYTFFSIMTNPKSSEAKELINKIKIVNPNGNYTIRVSALVLFGKAE